MQSGGYKGRQRYDPEVIMGVSTFDILWDADTGTQRRPPLEARSGFGERE